MHYITHENDDDSLQAELYRVGSGIEFSFRAHAELDSVHRRELSGLLIEAARIGLGLGGVGTAEYGTLLEPPCAGWERRARLELDLLAHDSCELEGGDLLKMQLDGDQKPSPEILILVGLNLWKSPAGYLALGQVLLTRGEGRRARDMYAELLRQELDGECGEDRDIPWRIREGLGAAWAQLGSDRLALGCLRKAVEIPGSGAGPLITAFFLALELGLGAEALDFGAQLDHRFSSLSLRLQACAKSLGARIQRRQNLRGEGCWTPPSTSVGALKELLASRGVASQICEGLVGQGGDFGGLAS